LIRVPVQVRVKGPAASATSCSPLWDSIRDHVLPFPRNKKKQTNKQKNKTKKGKTSATTAALNFYPYSSSPSVHPTKEARLYWFFPYVLIFHLSLLIFHWPSFPN
jgi:hypothetical protein